MLSEDKIIPLYCLVDEILKGLHYYEDANVKFSDNEVITRVLVSALYLGRHLDNEKHFLWHFTKGVSKTNALRHLKQALSLPFLQMRVWF